MLGPLLGTSQAFSVERQKPLFKQHYIVKGPLQTYHMDLCVYAFRLIHIILCSQDVILRTENKQYSKCCYNPLHFYYYKCTKLEQLWSPFPLWPSLHFQECHIPTASSRKLPKVAVQIYICNLSLPTSTNISQSSSWAWLSDLCMFHLPQLISSDIFALLFGVQPSMRIWWQLSLFSSSGVEP